ncbi:MAG TPA: hypothetical protein VH859_01745 [Candidatus Limnocylindria bacterium]|jgi:hypothetical protein
MHRWTRIFLLIVVLAVPGCARLSETDAAWCAAHREEVRERARQLGTEDEIDWPMQGPPDEFDARYAEACSQALKAR